MGAAGTGGVLPIVNRVAGRPSARSRPFFPFTTSIHFFLRPERERRVLHRPWEEEEPPMLTVCNKMKVAKLTRIDEPIK